MSVKISSLQVENVKRVKAVELEPTEDGLTVIGGRNGQGKTSVLDAIAWALGGEKMRPSKPSREGSVSDPYMRVELSNGIVVERKGKNSSLKVTDSTGMKGGQKLLDSFVEQLALDLPRFMAKTDQQKAATLLEIVGVGDALAEIERREKEAYEERRAVGRMRDAKAKAASELPTWEGVGDEPVDVSVLAEQQREVYERNAGNARVREEASRLEEAHRVAVETMERLQTELENAQSTAEHLRKKAAAARKTADSLEDGDPAEIDAQIASANEVNAKVADNARARAAREEADGLSAEYDALTESVESCRREKMGLLEGADMPLEGLSVESGALSYLGKPWDCMSASEQMRVATAIVRKLKPECGFVLVDKLEQLDPDTLAEFGRWCEAEGLQVIGTRVSTGDECSIWIDDGRSVGPEKETEPSERWSM